MRNSWLLFARDRGMRPTNSSELLPDADLQSMQDGVARACFLQERTQPLGSLSCRTPAEPRPGAQRLGRLDVICRAQLVRFQPLHPVEDLRLGTRDTPFDEHAGENMSGTVVGPARMIVAAPHPEARPVFEVEGVCADLSSNVEQQQLHLAAPGVLEDHGAKECGAVRLMELAVAGQLLVTDLRYRHHRRENGRDLF